MDMADNIKVRPSEGGVNVATDVVDGVHYPVYKTAVGDDGEAVLVSSQTPLPISSSISEEILQQVLVQLKKINSQLVMLTDVDITDDEVK